MFHRRLRLMLQCPLRPMLLRRLRLMLLRQPELMLLLRAERRWPRRAVPVLLPQVERTLVHQVGVAMRSPARPLVRHPVELM
jgi:hypothetical protein